MALQRDFPAEVAALESSTNQGPDVVYGLRETQEAWARSLLGFSPRANLVARVRSAVERGLEAALARQVAKRLEAAEKHQWEIGSWATSGAEGLQSMGQVGLLQLARAWLLAANAGEPRDLKSAHALVTGLRKDPNRVDRSLATHLAALEQRLEELFRSLPAARKKLSKKLGT